MKGIIDGEEVHIPLDIQWTLLKRNVGEDTSLRIKKQSERFFDSLNKRFFYIDRNSIEEVGKLEIGVHVIGYTNNNVARCHAVYDSNTGKPISEEYFKISTHSPLLRFLHSSNYLSDRSERITKTEQFKQITKTLEKNTFEELTRMIKPIKIYQISNQELSDEIGSPVNILNTGNDENYITAKTKFELKARAAFLGADALTHLSIGSHTQTVYDSDATIPSTFSSPTYTATPVKVNKLNMLS